MKLYVTYDKKKDTIKSHSRDKELHQAYMKTLKGSRYKELILDTKHGNKEMSKRVREEIERIEEEESEKTLAFMFATDEPVTEDEKDIFNIADEEYSKLGFLIKDLKNIVDHYDLNKQDRKQLKKSYKLLKELHKHENFEKATGLDALRDIVKNSPLINLKNIFTFGGKFK